MLHPLDNGIKHTMVYHLTEEGRSRDKRLKKKKKSKSVEKKHKERVKKMGKIKPALKRQFKAGRLYAVIFSRPGQSERVDGYVLKGDELAFF